MPKSKKPKVSVVIPSWNSEKQLKKNLRYVYMAADVVDAEVVVVDDASSHDDSVGYLEKEEDRGKLTLYTNEENQGFSYTVNKGVRLAQGNIVILLNTDVRPRKYCFEKCLSLFDEKPDLFAVTFNSGEAWMGGEWKNGLFQHFKVEPTEENKDQYNESLWASGGQAAFSKEKWQELNGMDLLYKPFYWEDTDLGYRAWKRGWRILWTPECVVTHDHAASVIASNFSKEFIENTAQRNQFLFVWKNIHDPLLMLSHLIRLPLYLIQYPKPVFRALSKLGEVLKKRKIEKKQSIKKDKEIIRKWSS